MWSNYYCILIVIMAFKLNPLLADWNGTFDAKTAQLIEALPALKHPDYLEKLVFFKKIRVKLLKDSSLVSKIKNSSPDNKVMVKKSNLNVIIKKRRRDGIDDFFAWELSYLTGSNAYVLPSFPVKIGGQKCIVQILESFDLGSKDGGGYPASSLNKVTMETYWKALLQCSVLGIGDMVATNIGISPKGIIRYFDNEVSLSYHNIPERTTIGVSMGFTTQSLDWPHYRRSIDYNTMKNIKSFIRKFSHFEKDITTYSQYRNINYSKNNLKERLDTIRAFPLREGSSFRDFIGWIYPKMNFGMDELNVIVASFMNKRVSEIDHGTSFFFMSRRIKKYRATETQARVVEQWIKRYVD